MIPNLRKNKKGRNKLKKSIFAFIFLSIIFLAIIGLLIISNVRINQKRGGMQSRIVSLKQEVQTLEDKKQRLTAQISQTEMESYLEKEARERFNLKKPGEEVIVFTKEKIGRKERQTNEKTFFEEILGGIDVLFNKLQW